MEKRGFVHRFIIPLVFVVGVMAVSSLIYHYSSGLAPGPLRNFIIGVSGPVMFLSIWFFGFVGPPIAYYRGATYIERLIIAFANPLIWVGRMEAKVACQFTALELVYFFFLPWTFGIVCVTLFEFSLADLVCRFIHRIKKPGAVKLLHAPSIVLLVAGLTGTYVALIRGQEWVYMVVHHYASHVLN